MYYTIYKVTNKLNGKYYIGKHQTKNPFDSYYGSGKLIVNAINKYGKDNFKKEILHVFETVEEMDAKERELITEEVVLDRNTYNAGVGGEGGPHFKGKKHTEESLAKISKRLKGKEGYYKGKRLSTEHKEKISKSCKKLKDAGLDYSKSEAIRNKNLEYFKR